MNQKRRERRTRQPSNVFSMLTPAQIKSLKIVFTMIDQNKDETICEEDLNNFIPTIAQDFQVKEFEEIEKDQSFYGILSLLSDKFIDLTIDSGAGENVMPGYMAPNTPVQNSTEHGVMYTAANGETMPNRGMKKIRAEMHELERPCCREDL